MPQKISSLTHPLLLVTRPEPAASETAASLRAVGYRVLISPALVTTAVRPRDLALPKATILVVTSPQAARFLRAWKGLHIYKVLAVGAQTAALLKTAGFTRVTDASGDAAAILQLAAKQKQQSYCLLGASTTGRGLAAALQAQGHQAQRIDVYRVTSAAKLSPAAEAALKQGQITHVLFYSARTAQSFLKLTPDIKFQPVTALCLSDVVAKAAKQGGFGKVQAASRPTAEALQALLPALDSRT